MQCALVLENLKPAPSLQSIDLNSLTQKDLLALVCLKLSVELGVGELESFRLLRDFRAQVLRNVLERGPLSIGEAPIDQGALARARRHQTLVVERLQKKLSDRTRVTQVDLPQVAQRYGH